MLKRRAQSVDALNRLLSEFDDACLFRGQTTHYEKSGHPSVVTSFDRMGCVPSAMLKWSRYASNVLASFVGPSTGSLEFTQALLQHYGWRSFFVDCTANAAVAAWFASYTYKEKQRFELSEDCEEDPVMLAKRMAKYEFVEGEGHLYVFQKTTVGRLVGVVDLSLFNIPDSRSRVIAQEAWLLGPIQTGEVPLEAFFAHIAAPRAVLRDYAASKGFKATHDLFPRVDSDPILRTLLSLPWKLIDHPKNTEDDIQYFERALDLPEYDESFTKIASRGVAYYRGARVANRDSIDGVKRSGIVIEVPEIAMFGSAAEAELRFPKVQELLATHGAVAFEVNDLMMHPPLRGSMIYQKGLVAVAHETGLIEVGELSVKHPGLQLTAAGLNAGWFYRVGEDGLWSRQEHPEQCDCGSELTHRHISTLHIIEDFLRNPEAYEKGLP